MRLRERFLAPVVWLPRVAAAGGCSALHWPAERQSETDILTSVSSVSYHLQTNRRVKEQKVAVAL